MKRFFHAVLVLPLVLFAVSCSESNDNGGGNDEPIKLSPGTELKQEAFADEEQALAPIKFTATAPWKATVAEIQTKAEAGRVDWLELSKYEGEKGEVSINMRLYVNTTGHDRKAKIRIACGDTTIVITVEQKGKTESGEVPEDPNEPKPNPIELSGETPTQQSVWADETQTPKNIAFKALAPWTATVAEVEGKADAGRVDWLALSAYEGGAGEVSLTATLLPNYTGQDRKAEIRIACGDKTIVLTVEQKGTKADGKVPKDPNKPELSDLKNRIDWIERKDDFYNESSRLEFSYDELGRLIQVSETWWVDSVDSNVTDIITGKITYGDKTVAYKSEHKEGTDISTSTGSTVLDENGRAVSDKITDVEEYEGNISTYENSSHFTYDANGQLVKTETIDKGPDNSVEHLCQISWTNGNPTQVIWTFNNYTTTGRATYGSVENKANLDLNWLIALATTDGWHSSIGDNQLLAVTGYMGKRSGYMAETVTETGENDNYSYTNEYQLDSEGRIAKIIIREVENKDTRTYTIHYAE